MTPIISQHFIKRINLTQRQLSSLLGSIAVSFNLGEIRSVKGIEEGYEDVNIELRTATGHYLCKILVNYLEKEVRSRKDSLYYIHVMKEFTRAGIRVPRLYRTDDGGELFETEIKGSTFRIIVMEFFEGKHFWQLAPSRDDIIQITRLLAKLHAADLKLEEHIYDDPWQPQFLAKHFEAHRSIFTEEEIEVLADIVSRVEKVPFSQYKKTPCHGDIMRNNIMKSADGQYCFLDFGVVTKNYWIIDLALFIAGFCLDPRASLQSNRAIYELVINTYQKPHNVQGEYDRDLMTLVSASYAAFFLAARIEEKIAGNDSVENSYWIELGREGMKMMKEIKS